ncbi:hypothetical protein MP228_003799 [Amoeboaphelidium protococcarum]|nr:hypothetical protein MP228_003799 [Amoeboaphelidium protococcarum]
MNYLGNSCEYCGKTLHSDRALKCHITKQHRNEQIQVDEMDEMYVFKDFNVTPAEDLFEPTLFDHDLQDLPRAIADSAIDIASPSIAPKVSGRDSIDAIGDELIQVDGAIQQRAYEPDQQMDQAIDIEAKELYGNDQETGMFVNANHFHYIYSLFTSKDSKEKITRQLKYAQEGGFNHGIDDHADLCSIVDSIPLTIQFKKKEVSIISPHPVAGSYFLHYSDVLQHIVSYFKDPHFGPGLILYPVRKHDANGQRVYDELHHSDWWLNAQQFFPPGHVIVPIMLSSDATLLNQKGRQTAHPLYMTIGNLPRKFRLKQLYSSVRAIGYLPIVKCPSHLNSDEVRKAKSKVFQACVDLIMGPALDVSSSGIHVTDFCGRHLILHPVIATYSADYQEVCQCICLLNQNYACPTCTVAQPDFNVYQQHDSITLRQVMDQRFNKILYDESLFVKVKEESNLFLQWPNVDMFQMIVPDDLHQIPNGVFKHLFEAFQRSLSHMDYSDAQIKRLVDDVFSNLRTFHNHRVFKNGVFNLSNPSAAEMTVIMKELPLVIAIVYRELYRDKNWQKFVLPLLLLACWHCLISVTCIKESDLAYADFLLEQFFGAVKVYDDWQASKFKFYKMHSLLHYSSKIREFGCLKNYSTQSFEACHKRHVKDLEKKTNHKEQIDQIVTLNQRYLALELMEKCFIDSPHSDMVDVSFYFQSQIFRSMNLSQFQRRFGLTGLVDLVQSHCGLSLRQIRSVKWYSKIRCKRNILGRQESVTVQNLFKNGDNSQGDYLVLAGEQSGQADMYGQFIVGMTVKEYSGQHQDLVLFRPLKPLEVDRQLQLVYYQQKEKDKVTSQSRVTQRGLKDIKSKIDNPHRVNPKMNVAQESQVNNSISRARTAPSKRQESESKENRQENLQDQLLEDDKSGQALLTHLTGQEFTSFRQMLRQRMKFIQLLSKSKSMLQLVQRLDSWLRREVVGDQICMLGSDISAMVDELSDAHSGFLISVFQILNKQSTAITLDCAVIVLPICCVLLKSKLIESKLQSSLLIQSIVHSFSELFIDARAQKLSRMGVNVVMEECYEKCRKCLKSLQKIHTLLKSVHKQQQQVDVDCDHQDGEELLQKVSRQILIDIQKIL